MPRSFSMSEKMKYVLLIIYMAATPSGWSKTKLHQEFDSMKSCQAVLQQWQQNLGSKIESAQCYYRSATPLAGDCKAWQQLNFKWTNTCLKPGNDVMAVCQMLSDPPPPYNKCGEK